MNVYVHNTYMWTCACVRACVWSTCVLLPVYAYICASMFTLVCPDYRARVCFLMWCLLQGQSSNLAKGSYRVVLVPLTTNAKTGFVTLPSAYSKTSCLLEWFSSVNVVSHSSKIKRRETLPVYVQDSSFANRLTNRKSLRVINVSWSIFLPGRWKAVRRFSSQPVIYQ